MTAQYTTYEIIEAVIAADGMSAALDRSEARLTVINDDLAGALRVLIPQAVALVVSAVGDVISGYEVSANTVSISYADTVDIAEALRTAIVWRALQLSYVGVDEARAQRCAAIADAAVPQCTPPCPAHRPMY
jgi:hypothetical protein